MRKTCNAAASADRTSLHQNGVNPLRRTLPAHQGSGRILLGLAIVLLPTLALDVALQRRDRVANLQHKLNCSGWFNEPGHRPGVIAPEDQDVLCDALSLRASIVVTTIAWRWIAARRRGRHRPDGRPGWAGSYKRLNGCDRPESCNTCCDSRSDLFPLDAGGS